MAWEFEIVYQSLYLLIRDSFKIWRLIKYFKSDIMLSTCFDYDIDICYIYLFLMHDHVESSLPMFPMITITMGKVYFQIFKSLQLTNIVIP